MTDFDEQLQARLRAFQEANGLSGDGVAGARTWGLLVGTPGNAPGNGSGGTSGGPAALPGPDQGDAGDAEELQAGHRARSKADARRMVDAHVEPKDCFIEFKSTRVGWGPISGTGCAHWVAHQRGGPTGGAHVCDVDFKYRVTEVLGTLTQASADLSAAQVGDVWSAPAGQSHMGIVRAVHRDAKTNAVTSVDVENDSSASGGVVTQSKTAGSIHR